MSIDTMHLKHWIRDNPEKAPSTKVVAAQHGISIDTLRSEFHRKEGITVAAFISEVRLEEVKKLLRRTDTRCFEIASQFTFGLEDVLSRWFKGRTGMTMQEFRHKNGQPKSSGGGGAKPKRK